jgi:hypothetical protein
VKGCEASICSPFARSWTGYEAWVVGDDLGCRTVYVILCDTSMIIGLLHAVGSQLDCWLPELLPTGWLASISFVALVQDFLCGCAPLSLNAMGYG